VWQSLVSKSVGKVWKRGYKLLHPRNYVLHITKWKSDPFKYCPMQKPSRLSTIIQHAIMTEEIVCSLVEMYNDLGARKLTLSMTRSAAVSLASIYDDGGEEAMQSAIYRVFEIVMRENSLDTSTTLPLRFFRNDIYFYYFVLAKQTESGIHIEMLLKDEHLRKRYL
jgi:hypothetical protein